MTGRHPPVVPKVVGMDAELANLIEGRRVSGSTGREASRAILREVAGLPLESRRHAFDCRCAACGRSEGGSGDGRRGSRRWSPGPIRLDPQDYGRRFLASNGGCAYIDLDHIELCVPEVRSAEDHLAAWLAMLRIARRAQVEAQRKLPAGEELHILVNNSDGLGHSYGSHLNVMITRRAWDNLFSRKLHYLLFLASYQVSSILFTGAGKTGSENGAPPAGFQLSQRADFFETLASERTTFRRPLVNSRDEALCGRRGAVEERGDAALNPPADHLARLHVIFFDSNLAHVAHWLKVGVLQILLALVEAEEVNPGLVLDDPLRALTVWSRDLSLSRKARTASGQRLTAIELQLRFLELATRFAEGGRLEGIVPDHRRILAAWGEVLALLEARDLEALSAKLDWALKLRVLRRAMETRPGLDWGSEEIRHLDLLYASLDPGAGIYWACEEAGGLERIVTEERIRQRVDEPPENTRAWTRAMLLRRARPHEVDDVDWDRVRFRVAGHGAARCRTVELANPLGFTRRVAGDLFRDSATLEALLDALDAREGGPGSAPPGWAAGPLAPGSSTVC